MPRARFGAAAIPLAVCLTTPTAAVDDLYDIDFSEPFHTPGLPPTIDLGPAPRHGPSSLGFGDPIVVSDFGPLTDGAARFESDGTSLSQMRFGVESTTEGLGVDFAGYRLEFDLVIDRLAVAADDFAVFFDTPQANRFSFRGDGLIQYGASGTFIGTFEEDSLIHVEVEYLGDAGTWSIATNGDELYSGPTQFAFDGLRTIRLSLDDSFALDSTVYVDNVVVQGIPAPSALALLLGAAPMCGTGRRARSAPR
jgi:hypothetical protein